MSDTDEKRELREQMMVMGKAPSILRYNVGDTVNIDLNKIQVQTQVRKEFDPEAHKKLVADIKLEGQRQPVEVYIKDGKMVLVTGERRYRALQELSRNQIKATIIEEPTPTEKVYLQVSENEGREGLTVLEIAMAMLELKNLGESISVVAKRFGVPRESGYRYIALAESSEKVKELYHKHRIVDLRIFQTLKKLEDEFPESVDSILPKIANGDMRREELDGWLATLRKNRSNDKGAREHETGTGELEAASDRVSVEAGLHNDLNPSERGETVKPEADAQTAVDDTSQGGSVEENAQQSERAHGETQQGEANATSGTAPLEARDANLKESYPTRTPIDVHYQKSYEIVQPEKAMIRATTKLIDGTKVAGTLMLERADTDSKWAWIQPDDDGLDPVRVEMKKIKLVEFGLS